MVGWGLGGEYSLVACGPMRDSDVGEDGAVFYVLYTIYTDGIPELGAKSPQLEETQPGK